MLQRQRLVSLLINKNPKVLWSRAKFVGKFLELNFSTDLRESYDGFQNLRISGSSSVREGDGPQMTQTSMPLVNWKVINLCGTVGWLSGRYTGISLDVQGVKDDKRRESNTSSLADKLHHFLVATATFPSMNRQPYTLSAASVNASRKFCKTAFSGAAMISTALVSWQNPQDPLIPRILSTKL